MKYFLDTEFIEGFHKPLFGKSRHYIDLISIGIYREDGKSLHLISSEYNHKDADDWVRDNVITPLYKETVIGFAKNNWGANNFHKGYGISNAQIRDKIALFMGCYRDSLFWRAPPNIEVYGYYSDYDWVLFCSLFGRMIDLPRGLPMYCIDLKQKLDEAAAKVPVGYDKELGLVSIKQSPLFPKPIDEHNALADAKWNHELYNFLLTLK